VPRYRTDDEERSPLPAYICKRDAAEKSAEAEVLYTDEYKRFGESVTAQVRSAYFRSKIFPEYRKKFIAITVYRPQRGDMISKEVAELDEFCKDRKIEKVMTPRRNLVYRIPLSELPNLVG
jgi:hypothetical protein